MISIIDTPLAGCPTIPEPRTGGWNPALEGALLPGAAAARAKLAAGALVVTTGQQPGLFTGPLYTVYKALSARSLAAALERRWGRPVVPVFWVAGDDHDYAEGSTAAWFGQDGGLVRATLDPRDPDAPLRPLAREPVPASTAGWLDDLERSLPASPSRDEVVAWLRRHYRTDQTLGRAFGMALAELLDPFGIVCLDASAPEVKLAATPLLLEAVRRAADLDALLTARAAELAAAGQPVSVKVGDGATLVFVEGAGGRDRLRRDGDALVARRSGERYTEPALAALARAQPERFSPNVLLRPVMESVLLPTVAYVGGPGELRYLRLAEVLYPALDAHRQIPVPRWSGVLVEPRVNRTADKFGLTVTELIAGDGALEQRVLKSLSPEDFDPAFAAARQAIAAGFERIAAVARQIDVTLEKPVISGQNSAIGQLGDLEKRLLQAQKRRQGELVSQLDRARTAVRPDGEPQERVLGFPAFAGRYGGPALLEQLATHIDARYDAALEAGTATP
ncbi:MAG: bacillithiol biosynthesis cysteine-adding enzyme BshC [Gemmatimonadales bacterium]|nr:bacillithiol biosynthesis cysteine-adding enzyme BshC [Gemmatimonadales bacterium]